MRVTEENKTEMYIELDDEDLPFELPTNAKKIYVRFKSLEGDFHMARAWKSKDEVLLEYPL